MGIQAVITGDIVNSTKMPAVAERNLVKILGKMMLPHKYAFYRGDSFQVYIKQANEAMRIALLCRTAAIRTGQENKATAPDIRLSIGIGKVHGMVRDLGSAKGEAFLLSGRAFDDLSRSGARLKITCAHVMANEALQVIADYINAIFGDITAKQAGVFFELLQGGTQQSVAAKFKKSKSTINQHVSAGRWHEIEKLLSQYEKIINQLP
jgi:hypothetical protein